MLKKDNEVLNMVVEISLVFSAVSLAFAIYFGLKNVKRVDTKDIEKRVEENTTINIKLDMINSTTSDIKSEISSMREEIKSLDKRMTLVEQSTKSAHHRLDGIDTRLNYIKEE